jgi:hypothetical protein
MDTSQAKSREFQLQVIDAEIKSLEESIRALKHRRNKLAPIASLPTEVIATIFTLLRGPVQISLRSLFKERPDHLPWFRVAHICHHWREIALDQPLFWSHVNFTLFSSAGAAEMLTRARTVPLHLVARVPIGHWNDARFSAFRNELQAHITDICHLDIKAEHSHLCKTLEGLVSPAPTLEYLGLSCEIHRNRAISTPVSIPDNIFDGTTPRLSSLVLQNCDIGWKSPLLRGLKCLDIESPFETPDLSVWLDMLDEMAQLKELTLHWALPDFPHNASLPSEVERIVTLPSLAYLYISDYAKECGLALAHLFLPALTRLCIKVNSGQPDGSDVQEILPFVRRHAQGLQCTQPLQSVLVHSEKIGADIFVWSEPDTDVEMLDSIAFIDAIISPPLKFSFSNEDWFPWSYTDVFDAVMTALPLDSLVTLISQNRRSPFEKQVWSHLAPRWPLLRRLHMFSFAARGFTEMLLEDKGEGENPLLPSLTKLVLEDIRLTESRTLRLRDALMRRVEQGVPLETLDLNTCIVTSRATSRVVELLSEIVVDVLGPEIIFEENEGTTSM